MIYAYRPQTRATLGDWIAAFLTTPRVGAIMAVPFLAVWLAMEIC